MYGIPNENDPFEDEAATDDSVVEMHTYKERDWNNPRTEILITEVEDGA